MNTKQNYSFSVHPALQQLQINDLYSKSNAMQERIASLESLYIRKNRLNIFIKSNSSDLISADLMSADLDSELDWYNDEFDLMIANFKKQISTLYDVETISEQIQLLSPVFQIAKSLLMIVKKEKNAWRRRSVMLLYSVMKQHCDNDVFSTLQIDRLIEFTNLLSDRNTTEVQYDNFDKIFFDIGMDAMPSWE